MSNFKAIIFKARIFFWGPIARILYFRRKRARYNKRFPIEWRTPRQLLFLDMENYEPNSEEFELNKDLLKTLADARDKIADRARRLIFVVYAAIAIVISRYFGVNLHIPIVGIDPEDFAFVKELLLIFSTIVSTYVVVLQNNIHTIESMMEFIIQKKLPPELAQVHRSMYLYSENFMHHIPVNIPYLVMPKYTYLIKMIPLISVTVAIFGGLIFYYLILNEILMDIWRNPSIPYWSRAAVIFIYFSIANAILFVVGTRFLMPYRNWIRLEKMQVLRDYWPNQFQKEFANEYDIDFNDETKMISRGYLKPRTENESSSKQSS